MLSTLDICSLKWSRCGPVVYISTSLLSEQGTKISPNSGHIALKKKSLFKNLITTSTNKVGVGNAASTS